uniref:Uncharacterized protein n=1 Tax=Anguilla anguilla TaxID=7936 RepID=A0A0E9R749_ANGAN
MPLRTLVTLRQNNIDEFDYPVVKQVAHSNFLFLIITVKYPCPRAFFTVLHSAK